MLIFVDSIQVIRTPTMVAEIAATLPGDTVVYIPRVGETTLEELRYMIRPELKKNRSNLSPEFVKQVVARTWRVRAEALTGKRRSKDVMLPRQVAMYVLHEVMGLALTAIGREFGGRDHSTVIHSLARVRERLLVDEDFRATVERLCAETAAAMVPRKPTPQREEVPGG